MVHRDLKKDLLALGPLALAVFLVRGEEPALLAGSLAGPDGETPLAWRRSAEQRSGRAFTPVFGFSR